MNIQFEKYQGTGNDFILIDDRHNNFPDNDKELIGQLCKRRFGIGADGLILIRDSAGHDFEMVYFNADGNISSFCGNGGRCAVAYAFSKNICKQLTQFQAFDGVHEAQVTDNGEVKLKMRDVTEVKVSEDKFILDTGSPHFVMFVDNVQDIDVVKQGQAIRYDNEYREHGINVNFVQLNNDYISVRTYERGVEDETFSCGTGVVASALSAFLKKGVTSDGMIAINVKTLGGDLKVHFNYVDKFFNEVWLVGPALSVYKGELAI